MKRSMAGGSHRGPVAHARQRRTIRLMQALLVVVAVSLLVFAGYSWGRANAFDAGRRSGELGASRPPGAVQVVVLALLGLGALTGAWLLGGPEGVRIPTPARLDELAGRAEAAAMERAEQTVAEGDSAARSRPERGPSASSATDGPVEEAATRGAGSRSRR